MTRARAEARHRHRLRPHPHRAGDRVRLLHRAHRVGAAGRGLPVHHHQQQPGDRLHRLRYLGQALLRAAHRRGRAQHHRPGSSPRAWWCSSAARPRSTWPGVLHAERGEAARHRLRRHRPGGGPRPLRAPAERPRHPQARRPRRHLRARPPLETANEIGYPVLVRPSYVLGGRGMEICYSEEELLVLHAPRRGRLPDGTRSWWTSTSRIGERGGGGRASATARKCSSPASWSTSSARACTPATPWRSARR